MERGHHATTRRARITTVSPRVSLTTRIKTSSELIGTASGVNKRLRACVLLLTVAIGCAKAHTASVPTPAIADRVSYLIAAAASSRATLDSAVLELYRTSGDTSSLAIARSRQLRKREASLDSTYRANVAELQWTVSAASDGGIKSNARFPIEPPPATFVRGFADGSNWMLQSPLIQEIGKNSRYVVMVPSGFVTDFASIPQPLQIIHASVSIGRYGNAAVVHDYLYWRQDCTREQSDNILAIAMREAGVSFLERQLIYQSVRQFGQSAWDGNKRAREAGLIRTVGPPNDQVPPTGTWNDYREWLRANHAKEGLEYRVPPFVCAMADSV
jgi:hypothetical protein